MTKHLSIDVRRTHRDDSLTALLDSQEHREPNRRGGINPLAISSIRTAEAMIKRARPAPGTTPAQIVAMLQARMRMAVAHADYLRRPSVRRARRMRVEDREVVRAEAAMMSPPTPITTDVVSRILYRCNGGERT